MTGEVDFCAMKGKKVWVECNVIDVLGEGGGGSMVILSVPGHIGYVHASLVEIKPCTVDNIGELRGVAGTPPAPAPPTEGEPAPANPVPAPLPADESPSRDAHGRFTKED